MRTLMVASLFVVALIGAGAVLAQPLRGAKAGACGGRSFDPGKIESISGRIGEVGPGGMGRRARGVHAWVETSSGRVEVMLGPADYVKAQPLHLTAGDSVEVRGWRVQMRRGELFVAADVRRGSDVLRLRDESGVPVWAPASGGGFGGPDDPCPCDGCGR